jgi:hypothetical protein
MHPFHMASAGEIKSASSGSSTSSVPYDEQIGETFTQNSSSLSYNVTAVAQEDQNGYGPAYLLNGLTSADYWYQIGLSYNWAETNGGYDSGFHANYNVFDSSTNVVYPTSGYGGVDGLSGMVNPGDTVELSLRFLGGNVLMSVHDLNTGASAQESYNAEGSAEFVGLAAGPSNSNGYFTGLMTEQYHSSPYYGGEKEVLYNNQTLPGLSSAYLWVDEYNVNTLQAEFSDSSLVSFSSNPSALQYYSLNNATEAANANDLITGSGIAVSLTVSYSVTGGGNPQAPTFSYVSEGVSQRVTLSNTPTTYFLDVGTLWSVTNPLGGSSERWISNQTTSGTANSQKEINFTYGHQYLVTISSNPSSDGSTNPSGAGWYNAGDSYNIVATPSSSYFLASWNSTPSLTISSTSSPSTSVIIGGSGTIIANFATTSVSLSSQAGTVSQGSSIRLSGDARGGGETATLSVSGLPSGVTSSFSVNPIMFSALGTGFTLTIDPSLGATPGTFTLTITSTASGSSPSIFTLTIEQAVPLTMSFTIEGSGTVSTPALSYTYNGTFLVVPIGTSPHVFYADQNTRWTVPAALSSNSSQDERWATDNATSGSAASPETINFNYYHQYYVAFNFSVVGGGEGYSEPTISAVEFDSNVSPTPGQTIWVDVGSHFSFSNPLSGSSNSERWMGNINSTSGQITSSFPVAPVYYHQFELSAGFATMNGSATPQNGPTFSFVNLGANDSIALTPAQASYWADAGSNYNVAPTIQASSQERWITNSTSITGRVSSPISLDPSYTHQYYLTIVTGEKEAATLDPTSGWINSGDSVAISALVNPGWQLKFWTGSGQGSYTGNANSTTIKVEAPIVENVTFYAGLTIFASGGGSVSYSFDSTSGLVSSDKTVYLPYGQSVTFRADPSSFFYNLHSWDGVVSGASSQAVVAITSPSTVSASFGYNLINIGMIIGVVIVVIVVILIMISRRKMGTPG